jgi:vacuolar-type H+-ATPase subunit H
MSYRNGDKSREHRLRKAREKKREVIREIKTKAESKSQPAAAKK